MKYRLKSALLGGLSLVFSAGLFAASGADPETQLRAVFDNADLVLHGTVVKATRHNAIPDQAQGRTLPEEYSILHMTGSVATPNGAEQIRGRYLLRVPDYWTHEQVFPEGVESIFFIRKNGDAYDPVLVTYPVINGEVQFNGRPIIVSDNETLEPVPEYNSCALEDYHAIYNPDEDLDLVNSFTCANGSQWTRGNEAPADVRSTGFSPEEFMKTVSNMMAKYNVPSPDIQRGLGQPPKRVLNPKNQLDHPSTLDWDRKVETAMKTLGASPESLNQNVASQVAVMEYIQRELARGKSPAELPQVVQDVHLPVFEQERAAGRYR